MTIYLPLISGVKGECRMAEGDKMTNIRLDPRFPASISDIDPEVTETGIAIYSGELKQDL